MFLKGTVQRGEILDKVPHTRSLDENDNEFIDFEYIAKRVKREGEEKATHADGLDWFLDEPIKNTSSSRRRYLHDIAAYRALVGGDWPDGWLIPEWVSTANYYSAPSADFLENLERWKHG